MVTWKTGVDHVEKTLNEQGHNEARLWTKVDGLAIFNNIVHGEYNDKAQLEINGSYRDRYWENTNVNAFTDANGRSHIAMVRYLDDTNSREWTPKDNKALVRGVQDVPELSSFKFT